jgi:hypothetical protein
VKDLIDPLSIKDCILNVKLWNSNTFSDFVEKPVAFVDHSNILFKKSSCNTSFKVKGEVVYVLSTILTSRSDYFRAMLEGSFKEAANPLSLDSLIPIRGISADVFEMIIEWIYTMDIRRLNGISDDTLLDDLERVYVAADMYLLPDLCYAIVYYLAFLVNDQTFGEIYQIAKRIEDEYLETTVFKSWVDSSYDFNKNDGQVCALVFDEYVAEDEDHLEDAEEEIDRGVDSKGVVTEDEDHVEDAEEEIDRGVDSKGVVTEDVEEGDEASMEERVELVDVDENDEILKTCRREQDVDCQMSCEFVEFF